MRDSVNQIANSGIPDVGVRLAILVGVIFMLVILLVLIQFKRREIDRNSAD